ncbi:unnamed protein product [Oncorhynchus mykiss]|uniref:Carbonic anhydrase n=1 Tax=Oncorhynchus mykiss TaxID=8022 RepID=A0A060XQQ0_ONCMY|nr:unnamed protein product [Oncorhynchus mykiss]
MVRVGRIFRFQNDIDATFTFTVQNHPTNDTLLSAWCIVVELNTNSKAYSLNALVFHRSDLSSKLHNIGLTLQYFHLSAVQVDLPATAKVQGGDLAVPYKAIQLHLHLGKDGGPGSEHTIDGEQYPMELHIVNIKEEYNSLDEALKDLAGVGVLGFFYEQSGSSNKKYESIINALNSINMPSSNTTLSDVSLDMFIPSQSNMTSYFRYQGSLTTPPCEEAVVWTVFKNTIPLSRQQLDAFSRLQFADGKPMVGTYRPVQPLNGRPVYRSGSQVILVSTLLLITSVISAIGLPLPK